MPIFNDPQSPIGKTIPLLPPDISRLRKGAPDNFVADKAYNLDPQFRSLADHYFKPEINSQLDEATRKQLPTMLLNMHYFGNPVMEQVDDLGAEIAKPSTIPNPFNPFAKGPTTLAERLNNARPQEGSILGNRGEKVGNLVQNIQQQQGGNLSYMNVPEIALTVAGQGIGAGSDMIGSAIAPALSPVVRSVQEVPGLLGPIAEGIGEGLEPIADWFRSYKEKNPRKGAAVEATGQIVSMLPIEKAFTLGAPLAKGLAKEGASLATKGAKAVAENIPTIPLPKSDRVADRLLQTALELNANQIRTISKPNIAGKNPFSWMRERGIIGTRNEVFPMLEELATTAKDAKVSALSGIGGKFAIKQSDQALDEVLKQLAPDGVPRAGLENLANEAALLRTLPEKSLIQIERAKSLMDDVLGMFGKTGDGLDNIKAQGWRNLRDNLKTFIEKQADLAGNPHVRRLNKDIQVSRSIIKALKYTGGNMPYTKLIPIIKQLGGAGGAGALGWMVAGPFGAFAGVGIERMLASPKVQTMMARMLARYSDDEITAVKALLEKGKASNTAKKVMDEISEDLSEVLRATDDMRPVSQGLQVESSMPSPPTLPSTPQPVNPLELPRKGAGMADDLSKKFPNLTKEEIASLTPEEKSTGLIGGSDSVKAVSKADDLTSSIQKAKASGQSFDEFVKKQPVVYHGSSTPLKKFSDKKGGVYFTDSMEDASGYAGSPDTVYEGYLNFKKPLVIDAKGAKWDNLNTKWGNSTQEVVSKAQKEGYDGVTFKNVVDNIADTEDFGGTATIHYAYKPETSFINESQLRAEWNKVTSPLPSVGGAKIPKPLEPLAAEARKYKSQYEFVSAMRKVKASEAKPQMLEAVKYLQKNPSGKGITDTLEDIWKQATGYVEPINGKPTLIEGTNLSVEDLPF